MKDIINKPYVDNYIFSQGNIYVHKSNFHIGYANHGSFVGANKIAVIYREQKEKIRQATEKQYINLLRDSINVSESSQFLIEELFKEKPNNFISSIDNQLTEMLNQSVDKVKAYNLMEAYKKTKGISKNLFSSNAKESIRAFDELLEILGKGASLLEGSGEDIANALLAMKGSIKNSRNSFLRMGNLLQKAVSKYAKTAEGKPIDLQRAAAAAKGINLLGEMLKTKKTGEGEDLTEASFRKALQGVFNTNFSESLAGFLGGKAKDSIDNALLSLSGTEGIEVQLTDEQGNVISKASSQEKRAGKADLKMKNFQMEIFNIDSGEVGNIDINLGFSNKFYMTQDFPSATGRMKNFNFSGGESGRVSDIITSLFGNSYNKYLAYNTLYHHSKGYPDYEILMKLMAFRNINRGFASRGGSGDFSQFIYANGEIISI